MTNVLLLATGNAVSYNTGDDGDLQRGIVKSCTALTSGQYSGTTNITVSGQTEAKSNNCVLDNNTGLMWTRYQSLPPIGPNLGKYYPDGDGSMPYTTDGDGNGLWPYLAAINAAELAGWDDWRVPNVFEAITIQVYLDTGMDYPPEFNGTINLYWTSTTSDSGTPFMAGTGAISQRTASDKCFVMLVREGFTSTGVMSRVRIGH